MAPDCSVGIDVGGERKGFHAVALRGTKFERKASTDPAEIVKWCLDRSEVVAVDAPCRWSCSGSSRVAERYLAAKGIHCFSTPTRTKAEAHKKHFYDWVFNGERLYISLQESRYQMFDGSFRSGQFCLETFPHAIVCALAGGVVPAKPKLRRRREVLCRLGYDLAPLTNIDFIDAALCAVTAEKFRTGKTVNLGIGDEGIIVLPAFVVGPE